MNDGVHDNGAWVHPVVGVHPVTGARYLNVNRSFTQHIVGMLKAESDRLLEYLYSHTVSYTHLTLPTICCVKDRFTLRYLAPVTG